MRRLVCPEFYVLYTNGGPKSEVLYTKRCLGPKKLKRIYENLGPPYMCK